MNSRGGLQPGRDPDDIDAAQAALNRMREAAAARGEIRRAAPRARSQKSQGGIRDTRGFSQFHGTGRDPLGLGKVVGRLVAERGWTSPVAVGSVMAEWATLVGPEISAHCTPESFTDTTLHVRCDSTAWATQLRLLSISLLEKFRHGTGRRRGHQHPGAGPVGAELAQGRPDRQRPGPARHLRLSGGALLILRPAACRASSGSWAYRHPGPDREGAQGAVNGLSAPHQPPATAPECEDTPYFTVELREITGRR